MIWESQNRQNRVIAVSLGTVLVLGLLFVGWLYFGRQPQYETLFSNLSTEDAATVTQRLKSDKVDYHISGDGKTISVPLKRKRRTVAIAGSGAPRVAAPATNCSIAPTSA